MRVPRILPAVSLDGVEGMQSRFGARLQSTMMVDDYDGSSFVVRQVVYCGGDSPA